MRVAHQNSSKILVVEDDAVTREVLVQLLRMAGFDALSAATGQQGLVLLRKHRREIGWLFTELEMPGLICGVMLADEFHQFQPSRPVVFASAHAGEDPIETAQAVVLPKPVSPLQVLEALRALRAALSSNASLRREAETRRAA
jgi:CheY-like chemotaxis protein